MTDRYRVFPARTGGNDMDEKIAKRMVALALDPYLRSDRKLRRLHERAVMQACDEEMGKIKALLGEAERLAHASIVSTGGKK